MTKPTVPQISNIDEPLARILRPLKESVEELTSQRGGKIQKLTDSTSGETLDTVNIKINEIIDRLQD